jgi:hypothetical protein
MKYLLKLAFCIAVLVSACVVNVYGEIKLSGDGGISFDGTGQLIVQQFPTLVLQNFNSNCTPSTIPGFIVLCMQPLDMSLWGNDIVRAEHVRIGVSLHDLRIGVVVTFGCPTCATSVRVEGEDDLVSVSPGVWRLSDAKAQALQALIDQHGAMSIYMSIGLNGGSIDVFSSVRAATMDIKPGDVANTLNSRSRGVVPVAILTTEEFDATSIDLTSLRFGATGEEAAPLRAVLVDVDHDGDTDLLVFFPSSDTAIDCETLFTYISGVTVSGVSIAGTDSVATVGCH